jgi:hypothetical protein
MSRQHSCVWEGNAESSAYALPRFLYDDEPMYKVSTRWTGTARNLSLNTVRYVCVVVRGEGVGNSLGG